MRKITAIFLILAFIMAVAVACGKDGNDTTTTQPINTQYNPATQTTAQPVSQTADNAASYVLTTNPDKTVPWVSTTRFEITEATTVPEPSTTAYNNDYSVSFNIGEISKPSVNVSQATTTTASPKTTADADNEEESTSGNKGEAVNLIVNSYGYGDGVIYVEVDPSNWDGNFVAKSQSISVKVDGSTLASSVTCKVPSKKTGGSYEIKIDLSSQDIPSGSLVEFTIPTGIVKNQSGSQYNTSYSASVTV